MKLLDGEYPGYERCGGDGYGDDEGDGWGCGFYTAESGDGYSEGPDNLADLNFVLQLGQALPPSYAVSGFGLPWAMMNTGLERRYAWSSDTVMAQ